MNIQEIPSSKESSIQYQLKGIQLMQGKNYRPKLEQYNTYHSPIQIQTPQITTRQFSVDKIKSATPKVYQQMLYSPNESQQQNIRVMQPNQEYITQYQNSQLDALVTQINNLVSIISKQKNDYQAMLQDKTNIETQINYGEITINQQNQLIEILQRQKQNESQQKQQIARNYNLYRLSIKQENQQSEDKLFQQKLFYSNILRDQDTEIMELKIKEAKFQYYIRIIQEMQNSKTQGSISPLKENQNFSTQLKQIEGEKTKKQTNDISSSFGCF